MRYHCAGKKQRSYAANGEEFWLLGVSHIEQHIKFTHGFTQLDWELWLQVSKVWQERHAFLEVPGEVYRLAGISVVATGFKFAFCSTAFALARSLF